MCVCVRFDCIYYIYGENIDECDSNTYTMIKMG